jgi:hypothetical protein
MSSCLERRRTSTTIPTALSPSTSRQTPCGSSSHRSNGYEHRSESRERLESSSVVDGFVLLDLERGCSLFI